MTQPALTRSVQALERELGAVLFVRHARGVTPTSKGALLVARAAGILAGLADLASELEALRGAGEGVLRVGAAPGPASGVAPDAVGRLLQRWEQLRVEIVRGSWRELTRALLAREIDLFVGERGEAERDARFEVVPLHTERGVWVCRAGHPLEAREELSLADLAAFPLAVPTLPERLPRELRAFANSAFVLCEDLVTLKRVVLASDAVGLQSRRTAQPELGDGVLRELRLLDAEAATLPGIVRLRHRPLSPAAAALIEELRRADDLLAGAGPVRG